jgi:uncharacterized protein YbjT (DUF2867 family)
MKTYAVLGATGNTGRPITLGLLAKGNKVKIVSRNAHKASDLVAQGAEVIVGESNDVATLKKVFNGAEAAYVLIPAAYTSTDFTMTQLSYTNAIADALRGSSVKYVVTLSSVGAHLPMGAGVVQGLQKMEQILNDIVGIHILHLRATYFLENGLNMAGMIKHMGMMGSPVRSDLKVPMVATKDIAAKALAHLLALDFTGKTHEYVLGAKEYTYNEIASIYGKAIGKPDLKYVQFPYAEAKKGMMGAGMSENVADRMNEFVKTMNDGKILEEVKRTPSNTTPTTAEEFSQVFKAVYEKS